MSIDMFELAHRCKKYRQFLGITQKEVAKEVGVSDKTISAFECGANNNATILMWYILHGFGVEDEDLKDIIKNYE